jgi:hypothetical protein
LYLKKIGKKRLKEKLLIGILLFAFVANVQAQSDNYWSWNFNTPSTLLAGAVVGGSAGPSAVYYNPALIDHENVPSFSLSANIISLQFFKAENIAGEGIDADKFVFKVQPRFISYVLPNKNERLGFEAAILSPASEEINYTIQHFDELDIIQRTAGSETYSGYLKYSRKYDDTWAGFGASYRLSDNFYIGASSFLSIKVLKYQFRRQADAYQEGDSVLVNNEIEPKYIAQNSLEEEMKYWELSFIFKVGAQYKTNNERFSVGINLTFPNIPFIGQADVRKAVNRSNVYDNNSNSFTSNDIFIGYEEKIKPRIQTPFSAAVGLQYFTASRKNSISFTAEYFSSIDPYPIVESSVYVPQEFESTGNTNIQDDFMSYYTAANSVTNFAIGFKQYISSTFFLFGGFRTDFTSGVSDDIRFVGDKFKINQIHIDKYHITVGPVLTIKRFQVVTGLQYSFGRNNEMLQVVNYSDPVEYNPITNQALEGMRQNTATAKVNELAFFFGAIIDLTRENN